MKKNLPLLKKVLFELAIVFTGVFLAFQLNSYQEDIADKKIQKAYYNLILIEFQSNLQEIKFTKQAITSFLDTLNKQIENGNKPNIVSFSKFRLENNLFVIKSAFESGHLENLKPKFVANISSGSNYITRLAKLIDQFNDTVSSALQKNDWQNDRFYNDKAELKAEYQWYLEDLEFIQYYLSNLENALENGAIPDIKKIIEEGT